MVVWLALLALLIELMVGYPDRLARAIGHPVSWIGRLIGALGGADVWDRLTGLHYTLVGLGRTGSLVAHTLARRGARRLTLIDPDAVSYTHLTLPTISTV